jgi:hypothetical protein
MEAIVEIRETAERILASDAEPTVRVRLLRDVLRRPDDDAELAQARKGLDRSPWVQLLQSLLHEPLSGREKLHLTRVV